MWPSLTVWWPSVSSCGKYKHRVDPTKIIARSVWRKGMETAEDLVTELPVSGN